MADHKNECECPICMSTSALSDIRAWRDMHRSCCKCSACESAQAMLTKHEDELGRLLKIYVQYLEDADTSELIILTTERAELAHIGEQSLPLVATAISLLTSVIHHILGDFHSIIIAAHDVYETLMKPGNEDARSFNLPTPTNYDVN